MAARDVACVLLLGLDVESTVLYASASIEEILGYKPSEIVGQPITSFFDPEERDRVQQQRYQTLANDKITDVTFHRYRHKDGHYVLCEAGLGVVYDKFVGSLRRAVEGPRTMLRSSTAQDVSAISRSAVGRFTADVWDRQQPIPLPSLQDQPPWESLPTPGARTCFILDRFSNDSAILHVSNDVLYSRPQKFDGVPFYDLVRLSDRQRVREYIDFAKSWLGPGDASLAGSHHAYCRFGIFDDKEGIMEAQAVITAYSDGVVCVIRRREATPLQRTESTSTDLSRQSSGNRLFTELTEERFK